MFEVVILVCSLSLGKPCIEITDTVLYPSVGECQSRGVVVAKHGRSVLALSGHFGPYEVQLECRKTQDA